MSEDPVQVTDEPGTAGERMFHYDDRLLVAVSGGKDSLPLGGGLLAMGYDVDGLYAGPATTDTCAFWRQRAAILATLPLARAGVRP